MIQQKRWMMDHCRKLSDSRYILILVIYVEMRERKEMEAVPKVFILSYQKDVVAIIFANYYGNNYRK